MVSREASAALRAAFHALEHVVEVAVDLGLDPRLKRAAAASVLSHLLHLAHIGAVVQGEAERIERKFSRYRPDSVVGLINATAGSPFDVDRETAGLLGYAGGCYHMSDGAFDITSGVLRQAWTFDGSSRIPDHAEVERLLPLVGWVH